MSKSAKWSLVAALVVAGLTFTSSRTAEARRRGRPAPRRPVYYAPYVAPHGAAQGVHVRAPGVRVDVGSPGVHVRAPGVGVHVYRSPRYGPRVVTPWITVW